MMWNHYWFGGGGLFFVGLLMLLFLVGLVVLIVWALRALGRSSRAAPGPQASPEKTPLDIVKERYARGEINREQYEVMRQDLGK